MYEKNINNFKSCAVIVCFVVGGWNIVVANFCGISVGGSNQRQLSVRFLLLFTLFVRFVLKFKINYNEDEPRICFVFDSTVCFFQNFKFSLFVCVLCVVKMLMFKMLCWWSQKRDDEEKKVERGL